MASPVDIPPDHLEIVQDILQKYLPPGTNVYVFGSRADWTTKNSSDLDLALEGGSELEYGVVGALEDAFEESDLPYAVDVVDLNLVGDRFRQIVDAQAVALPTLEYKNGAGDDRHCVPLRDVIDLRISGVDKKTKDDEQAVRLCNYTDVYNNNFIYENMDFMAATATESEISKCLLSSDDVVITKDSEKHDDIGVPALVRENIPNLICGYHLAILRPTPKIDGAYLYYALNTDGAKHQFQSYANGITRFGLRKADIGLVKIPLPSLREQRRTSAILRTLDDKIELNRQMNKTLEEMARILFKSWFVDFEPVRAKLEGQESYLLEDMWSIFSNSLVDSELGNIPKMWKVKQLGEVTKVVGGTTPSTKITEYWDGGTHCWATPKDLSVLSSLVLLDTERKITDAGLSKISSGLLPPGTLLLSSRAPIGYTAISEMPTAINQGFIAMPPGEISNLFLLFWCREFHEKIINYANGSTFLEINKANFRNILLVVPPKTVLSEFDRLIKPAYEQIVSNENESRTLVAQRDSLLPKLISGELRANPGHVKRSNVNMLDSSSLNLKKEKLKSSIYKEAAGP